MRVLIACEFSGRVRNAFAQRGHDAVSCDLLPSETPGKHIQGNVLEILNDGWDLMVAHPPCTHLSISGSRWWKNKMDKQVDALEFVRALMAAPIDPETKLPHLAHAACCLLFALSFKNAD